MGKLGRRLLAPAYVPLPPTATPFFLPSSQFAPTSTVPYTIPTPSCDVDYRQTNAQKQSQRMFHARFSLLPTYYAYVLTFLL